MMRVDMSNWMVQPVDPAWPPFAVISSLKVVASVGEGGISAEVLAEKLTSVAFQWLDKDGVGETEVSSLLRTSEWSFRDIEKVVELVPTLVWCLTRHPCAVVGKLDSHRSLKTTWSVSIVGPARYHPCRPRRLPKCACEKSFRDRHLLLHQRQHQVLLELWYVPMVEWAKGCRCVVNCILA
jgi:hypothetical protein